MKNRFGITLLFIFLFTSCSFGSSEEFIDPNLNPTPVIGVLTTIGPTNAPAQPLETPVPFSSDAAPSDQNLQPMTVVTLSPSAQATAQLQAHFRNLRFSTAADARPQQVFPAGTEEIFAIWDYHDMEAGDRIRRIWFRDEQIWLTREENWNWGHYRESGTVSDISVYDNEGDGLQPGIYRIQLYVNDILQQESTFTILDQ